MYGLNQPSIYFLFNRRFAGEVTFCRQSGIL